MKYKTILIDDEPLALTRLRRLLEPYEDTIDVVGTAGSGADAVEVINRLRPNLIFLDIQMPELNGFDVLERLHYMPYVIFSTAYDQYALKAFDVHSVDYLLKPVDPGRLELAVEKLRRFTDGSGGDLGRRIQLALDTLKASHKYRIQVKTGDRIKLVEASDVVFFYASDKYVEVHTCGESYLITKSLSKLESELPSNDFVRVHRSAIVNINFIDEITKDIGGAYEVRMKDAKRTRLPVSRRYKSRLDLK